MRRFQKIGALLIISAMLCFNVVVAQPQEADAYWTGSYSSNGNNYNPNFYFAKGTNTNSTLTFYMSYYGTRYYMGMQAGSGLSGVTNDCTTNQGWLPNGTYDPQYQYKTWGVPVVQGAVWYIGDKLCSNGWKWRTELFIHSSGIEGTAWNGNYQSNGCIKISQSDRSALVSWFLNYAYNRHQETLTVY